MCGGTCQRELSVAGGWGLSPRVRGNRQLAGRGLCARRSIPACAGEPFHDDVEDDFIRVYPRVCGGTSRKRAAAASAIGLSPRVRGNPQRRRDCLRARRSIPARAGEPVAGRRVVVSARVYPRVCGGTPPQRSLLSYAGGLSPRVRGNLVSSRAPASGRRSIPACAGEPQIPNHKQPQRRVYPRVCGGTDIGQPSLFHIGGLSPRVRGNRTGSAGEYEYHRSIPACAGEPPSPQPGARIRRVYPRVCGGTWTRSPNITLSHGLSPRVRGNLRPMPRLRRLQGSIPACAGEPRWSSVYTSLAGVYPRVCGGTHFFTSPRRWGKGLSPRVRGNRHPMSRPGAWARSIPACAGEPITASAIPSS